MYASGNSYPRNISVLSKPLQATIVLIPTISNITPTYPRSVAVNHAGLWIRRHQFESGRGYLLFSETKNPFYIRAAITRCVIKTIQLRLRIYLSLLIVVLLVGMLGMITFENRTPLDAVYFVVVTISTVGFGDIAPVTPTGKVLTMGVILVGVGCFVGLAASTIDLMIEKRERTLRLRNLNMMVGVFFSEVGTDLLRCFSVHDHGVGEVRSALLISDTWSDADFTRAFTSLQRYSVALNSKTLDLSDLNGFLKAHKTFLLTLFENPQIIEHEGFTPLLQAVFHLAEELAARDQLTDLPASDYAHLSGDINRVYGLLITEWLAYMRHLKMHYPYLFSLAMRTNPFDAHASAIVR